MINRSSRRRFIAQTALAGMAFTGISGFAGCAGGAGEQKVSGEAGGFPADTGFDQTPLPYAYDALEPVIDAATMELHYSRHAAGYAKNLQAAAGEENLDTSRPLEELLSNISRYSTKARNNGGGHYNHELFWKLMTPGGASTPSGRLMNAIERDFGSFDAFKTAFSEAGATRFGSGWAWLVADREWKLSVGSTPNQDNPLMDLSDFKGYPLLALDVWEHAYYLHYQNRRADYIAAWWQLVNWDLVSQRYEKLGA